VVALGATGLPPGPTLGVTGRLVAETVTPAAGTGTGEVDGKTVAVPSLNGPSGAGADEMLMGVTDPRGENGAVDDMETAAVLLGLDDACWVVARLELSEDPEASMLVPSFDVTMGKAPLVVSPVAEVIEPALGGPA